MLVYVRGFDQHTHHAESKLGIVLQRNGASWIATRTWGHTWRTSPGRGEARLLPDRISSTGFSMLTLKYVHLSAAIWSYLHASGLRCYDQLYVVEQAIKRASSRIHGKIVAEICLMSASCFEPSSDPQAIPMTRHLGKDGWHPHYSTGVAIEQSNRDDACRSACVWLNGRSWATAVGTRWCPRSPFASTVPICRCKRTNIDNGKFERRKGSTRCRQ